MAKVLLIEDDVKLQTRSLPSSSTAASRSIGPRPESKGSTRRVPASRTS